MPNEALVGEGGGHEYIQPGKTPHVVIVTFPNSNNQGHPHGLQF